MAKLKVTHLAETDLAEIVTYIGKSNPKAARDFLSKLRRTFHVISEYPSIGWERSEIRPSLHAFPIGKYLVFYRKITGGIEVLRVVHGARDVSQLPGL